MPVLGIALDELFTFYGETLTAEELENELHRFGCSVEGWATLDRYRCKRCGAVSESAEPGLAPAACDGCGADLRDESAAEEQGQVRVLKMELLAVRPDLFHPAGLARALRGFLGKESGAPSYALAGGAYSIDVDSALAGPDVVRPRIASAVVRDLEFDDTTLRSLMKLQENLHWALGRDRKLASIGVYDLERVNGTGLRYRAVARDALRFVPLGFDAGDPGAALTPGEILEKHPKGVSFARLLKGYPCVPLLEDGSGGVLSMPPIINSEATRVTRETRDVLIDVTGLADRQIDRALNIVVCSLLEACPAAAAETVEVRYEDVSRVTPDLTPQVMDLDPRAAAELIGQPWTKEEVIALLGRMRHDATPDGESVRVRVPAWRADILHPRDLVEDVAIAHGYDRLPRVEISSATFAQPHPDERISQRTRHSLCAMGAIEVMTLSLSSEEASFRAAGLPGEGKQVRLEHPISIEQTMLRVSLIPGLLETLALNLGHGYPQRIFEVGHVSFVAGDAETGAREELRAAVALAGDGIGFADIRGVADTFLADWGLDRGVEYRPCNWPLFLDGRGAELSYESHAVARLGEVHPAILERYRVIHPVALVEFDLQRIAKGHKSPGFS